MPRFVKLFHGERVVVADDIRNKNLRREDAFKMSFQGDWNGNNTSEESDNYYLTSYPSDGLPNLVIMPDISCSLAPITNTSIFTHSYAKQKRKRQKNGGFNTLLNPNLARMRDALRHTSSVGCLETFRSIFAVTLPMIRSNSCDA
ncbi:hypothetical protein TNCV_3074151 [Trichonephila clavipes]|uniref:Uncharacterized protein n=1 Tax=Trichonephila clavipes TaxID=2585209 RepID=A0A8X6SKE7_TRICX|nr:hypothetical protein TNCV_3074151 [Trichonephila clavipes]